MFAAFGVKGVPQVSKLLKFSEIDFKIRLDLDDFDYQIRKNFLFSKSGKGV